MGVKKPKFSQSWIFWVDNRDWGVVVCGWSCFTMNDGEYGRLVIRICGNYAADGSGVSTSNLRYKMVRRQLEYLKDLLGEDNDPLIEFDNGSLRIAITMLLAFYTSIVGDIKLLNRGVTKGLRNPNAVNWYNRIVSDSEKGFEYHIEGSGGEEIAIFKKDKSGKLKADKPRLLSLTSYLNGKVTSLGGKNNPNMHLLVRDNKTIMIQIDADTLSDLKENIVYKIKNIKVSYDYNPSDGSKENYRFLGFVEKGDDGEAMKRFVEHGTRDFAGVVDHVAWVREMRGGEEG